MLDVTKSHITKGMLLRLLETVGEDTVFMIANQEKLDMEEEWNTSEMLPVRSLSFFRENDKTIVVFGMDER